MSQRRFPRADADFAAAVAHYYDAVEAWWTGMGLDPADLNDLKDAVNQWKAAYPAHVAAQAAARAATRAKDAARAEVEAAARPITNFIQAFPKTTDADRAEIGITVRGVPGAGAGNITSAPVALIDSGQRLTHTLRLSDGSTPTRRARPRGVARAEVFVALTDPHEPAPPLPTDTTAVRGAYRYIGSVTDGTATLTFESESGGRQAHYIARWITTAGHPGPWSETASATVAA